MRPRNNIEAHVELVNYGRRLDVHILDRSGETTLVAQPVSWVEIDQDAAMPGEPTLSFSMKAGQALMDGLWQCGLRPTEGTGSAGALAATQLHLKDMQRIATAALKHAGIE